MSFFDDASLVTIPSGIKDGVVYSVKPIDGSGDLTFSRGSDIEATRVNANGYIEKAQVNLLLQSNTFNTTWLNVQSSTSTGFSGYDGSSDAWKAVENTVNSNHYAYQNSVNTGVSTLSVYAKTNGRDLQLRVDGVGTNKAFVNYDLSAGSIGLSGGTGLIDSNIESVGGGWYRCSFAVNDSGTYGMGIVMITDAATSTELSSYLGDGVSGIFIQDAQVNYGLVAQTYQETTTAAVVSGITNDMPRLNYDPANPTCPSLLLEGSRTNLITHSEYIGAWTGFGGIQTITDNFGISPEGVQNAARVQLERSPSLSRIQLNASGTTSGVSCVFSVYLKANSGTPAVYLQSGPNIGTAIELTNEWQRCELVGNASGSTTTCIIGTSDSVSGTTATADILVYGAQLESSASYASSLIPTYGSSATRTADACSKTGISSLIGQTEGTLFVEASALVNGADGRITLSDGTINNRVSIEWDIDADTIKGFIGVGGNVDTTSYDQTNKNKIALVYTTSFAKLFVNGALVSTDSTSIPTMSGMGQIDFSNYGGGSPFWGNVYQTIVMPTALSDADAITLTTL